jgi:hypothetical protein
MENDSGNELGGNEKEHDVYPEKTPEIPWRRINDISICKEHKCAHEEKGCS